MHKWIVELWRDGEKVRSLEFTEEMIKRHETGEIVIRFPPIEMGGGLHLASHDELHLSELPDGSKP